MKIRKYRQGDIYSVISKRFIEDSGMKIPEPENESLAWTATESNSQTILCCGGFRPYWKGVYEAWFVPVSPDAIHKNKFQLVRFTKKLINELGAHRIQASILRDSEKDVKYVKLFGFRWEGTLYKYGPDKKDYDLYSLVR